MSRPSSRQAILGAAAGVAVMSLRALARPLPVDERRLLDWELVRRVAKQRSGERGPTGTALMAPKLGAQYDAIAAEMAPLMASVVSTPVSGYPRFSVLDRAGFIDRNLGMVQRMLAPVERLREQIPESRATALSRVLMSRYVGELFGFMSQRVLGQYDPVLMLAPTAVDGEPAASALYLVEPNVELFESRHDVSGETLRRWLVLHELTHAWQFEAHPWLREHLGAMMNELLMAELMARLAPDVASGGGGSGRGLGSTLEVVRALPSTVRSQLRTVGRVQAVMSICEGYSNYVMHQVGSRHLAGFDSLETAFHDRSARRSPLERLVFKVTGLSMKMRQYEMGERFSEQVVERGGLALLNRVWEGPEMMPSMAELEHPERWVVRVGGATA
ncbi:MAG TPA: zinc-dependent metalloprotease [Candidatus Angelobacter sp.]|jgi:coenzyme F420 biosynthesis associated uncharacterized protein|nr:zinc-dependent metalloprotease [Candidatus Angelobacter sp.]